VNCTLYCKPKEFPLEIHKLELPGVFPNIIIALRIFVSLPVSVASGERTVSVFKQVTNYCRSTVGHYVKIISTN
jgi:hypothetical protein